jgi:ketosteroid isomerase-like protein
MTNTEIVKGMFEAFNRGEIAGVLNGLADNVEWVIPGPSAIPYAGVYGGRDGVAGFFQKLAEVAETDPLVIHQYVAQGDVVVATGSSTGRSKEQQRPVTTSFAMVFTLSGGKVTKFEEYLDTAAVASAFLSEAQAARG